MEGNTQGIGLVEWDQGSSIPAVGDMMLAEKGDRSRHQRRPQVHRDTPNMRILVFITA